MAKVTQAHIDARTQDILDASMRMFARKGVGGTTMQEIAAQAGLSAGAIYRYYPSKEHLLRAVFSYCTRQNQVAFDQAAASTESPLQAILGVGRAVLDMLKMEGARDNTMLELETALAAARQPEELGPERDQMYSTVIEMLERLVRRAQTAGEIDLKLDARALAITLLALSMGTSLLALELGGEMDTEALFKVVTEILHRLAPERN